MVKEKFLETATYLLTGKPGLKRQMQNSRNGTLDKMVVLNEKRKLLYIVVPKAGNTTIKQLVWSDFENLKTMQHMHRGNPSTNISDLSDGRIAQILHDPQWLKFSFVRNPYTRVVSSYKNKILTPRKNPRFLNELNWKNPERMPSFDEFIRIIARQDPRRMDWHWQPQHLLLMQDVIHYQHIGKLENFAADMQPVMARFDWDVNEQNDLLNLRLNPSEKSLPSENSSRIEISDETAALIQTIYKADFEQFGYQLDAYR